MAKRSRSSRRLQTEKASSVMTSQPQQEQPGKQETTQTQPEGSPMLSEEELNEAILMGRELAMLDALSMLRRKAALMRSKPSQP